VLIPVWVQLDSSRLCAAVAKLLHSNLALVTVLARCACSCSASLVLQPVYGFSSKDPAKFLRVAAHPELMYMQDPEVSFNQVQHKPAG